MIQAETITQMSCFSGTLHIYLKLYKCVNFSQKKIFNCRQMLVCSLKIQRLMDEGGVEVDFGSIQILKSSFPVRCYYLSV